MKFNCMKSIFSIRVLIPLTFFLLFSVSCNDKKNGVKVKDYPVSPVPFTKVSLSDSYWLPRILTNTNVTIPIAFKQSEETGRIKNFEIAGGKAKGRFCSKYGFDDSDVFKIIEGAAYSLMVHPDPVLENYLDSLIATIAGAQEPDGYIYTNRTIMGDSALPMAGKKRWEKVIEGSHELYNVGHMYEAAVAYYQATGKRAFLDVAIKNADLINRVFGWGKIEKYPGHQEIEIGLVKLYRVTGDKKYLDLAKFFLDVRGPGGWEYHQAHKKVTEQTGAVGHAVRACYMYSAMADVAALTGDTDYIEAINRIWEDVVYRKMYITGGIGQSGKNEGFGPAYDLPNRSAYCETCASIAFTFWNYRMFLLTGDAKYVDVMERTMYNALLSGVSLTGDRFFYDNVLESAGDKERRAWFGCACCPSNITRFLPSVPGYIYAQRDDKIYINLFISGETKLETGETLISIKQESHYPWKGDILITVNPEKPVRQTILIRIPGWAVNRPVPGNLYHFATKSDEKPVVKVNGKKVEYKMHSGYAKLDRKWHKGDKIELYLPMPVRKVMANSKVKADSGRIAIQRGPVVYCIEGIEPNPDRILNLKVGKNEIFKTEYKSDLLNGVQTVYPESKKIEAIPYCTWENRGKAEMEVWMNMNK